MSQNNNFSTLENLSDASQHLPTIHSMGSLPALLRSCSNILGWNMRFVPVDNSALPSDLAQALKNELENILTSDDPRYPSFSSLVSYNKQSSNGASLHEEESFEAPVKAREAQRNSRQAGETTESASVLRIYTDWDDNSDKQDGFDSSMDYPENTPNRPNRELDPSDYSPALLPAQRPPQPIPVEIRGVNGKPTIVGNIVYSPMDNLWSDLHALARQAAVAMADMVAELLETRYQLWRREAELATKTVGPLNQRLDKQLAFVFQDILHNGADCMRCQATAMYLLDDDTSCLKMRSCWGLPAERLQDPPRTLVSAMADLEAMVGHVVVLEDTRALEQWQAPEDFPSALCVPLLSDSNILGTLWFFSQKRRTFSDAQTQIAEMVAGRLTGELERASLQEKCVDPSDWTQDVKNASLIQKNQLPVSSPWMVGWDLSASVYHSRQLGGNFYDWFSLANGQTVVALGDCQQRGMTGAVVSEAVKTALRCHAGHSGKIDSLVEQVDRTIWSSSAADQYANLFAAIVQPDSDLIRYAAAGSVRLFHVSQRGWEDISLKRPLLGQTAQTTYESLECGVCANEILLVLSNGVGKKYQSNGQPLVWTDFLQCAQLNLSKSAKAIARELKSYLEVQCPYPSQTDYSLLVIKRKN